MSTSGSQNYPQRSTAARVLGVATDASDASIKDAWRRRSSETHPDHGGDPGDFQKVQAAYYFLIGSHGSDDKCGETERNSTDRGVDFEDRMERRASSHSDQSSNRPVFEWNKHLRRIVLAIIWLAFIAHLLHLQ